MLVLQLITFLSSSASDVHVHLVRLVLLDGIAYDLRVFDKSFWNVLLFHQALAELRAAPRAAFGVHQVIAFQQFATLQQHAGIPEFAEPRHEADLRYQNELHRASQAVTPNHQYQRRQAKYSH